MSADSKKPRAGSIRLKLSSFDISLVEKSSKSIIAYLRQFGADFNGAIPLPRSIKKLTVNRSPHIDRRSMEQLEIRQYTRLIIVRSGSAGILQDMVSKISLPAGVKIDVKSV